MSEFKTEEKGKAHIIEVPNVDDKQLEELIAKSTKSWLLMPSAIHILDLNQLHGLSQGVIRLLLQFKKDLTKGQKFLASINVDSGLKQQLNLMGLVQSFGVAETLDQALSKVGLAEPKKASAINTEFINPFILATKNTLEVQVGVSLVPQKPYAKKQGESTKVDIAGVVNLSCPEFAGAIAVCFRKDVFLSIYEKMLDEKHEEITGEVKDAAGELMNIIFGQAKTQLKEKGYGIEMVIPTVLTGNDIEVSFRADAPVIILPFKSDVGDFHIEIIVDKVSSNKKVA